MDNLFLTGFMATGKTTVGRMVAERLGRRFIDLDSEIERRAGASVAEIFIRLGEEGFRSRESELLAEVCGSAGAVIATGGGVVLEPKNRAAMRAAGRIVCLAASRSAILSRLGEGGDRPLLAGGDRERRLDELLAARASAYVDADLTLDTSGRAPAEIAAAIVEWLVPRRSGQAS